MDEDYQSLLFEICKDLKVLFDSYFSDQTLLVTIHHAIWPITQDALHRVFSPYGSVKKIIPSQNVVDIQFLVQFQGYGAVAARSSLQGRNIYDGCCQLDIQFWDDARITEFVDLKIETRVKATESDEPLMLIEVVEHKQESELNDINDNKVLDELSVKTDEKSDGLDNPKKGLPDDGSTKILLELPKSKALNFEGCDDVTKWLLKPSLAQGMRLNSLMEDEKNCHQTCQFKQLENTIENVVEGHGSGMKSREWNQYVEWITPIGVGNHKTSLLPHGQGVAGITMVHNVKFQLLDNPLVESDDPYRFRLLLMGNKLLAVDKDSMKHLTEVDKNLQNLKSSFYPLGTFVHPYGTVQPMNKCMDTYMMERFHGDKQGKRYQIWLDCISISQIGSDSWLVKFAKWESIGEDRYSCLITVLLTTKQVEESFTWMHIHHIWLDDLKAKGEHKNNIPYYSLDHKIEVENFSEISLILDEIYEVQLGYSSGISVAAPFYLEALLPVQEPFWTKAKRAFGNVWSNHLKKFRILAFVFKGGHGICCTTKENFRILVEIK
ncbi:hypothetical protein GQ457_06G020470 [Hibiscus cannabinus]